MPSIQVVPQFDLSNTNVISKSDFEDAYNTFQAIRSRGFDKSSNKFCAQDVLSLFQSLSEDDKTSWCIENKKSNCSKEVAPCDFLNVNNRDQRGYCSFLVQHSAAAMEDLEARLPLVDLPIQLDNSTNGPCIWFFFGKNYNCANDSQSLLGRPEHTDSVSHDGTWHYQLSGTKVWRLRPTDELLERIRECNRNDSKKRKFNDDNSKSDNQDHAIEVICQQGDILLLNTRLWWHSTVIPSQDTPSISYARDVYFQSESVMHSALKNNEQSAEAETNQQSMTNVDGTYAAQDIEADTILFTEHTMPDCELHRSKTNPNCQVVELEDEETGESYMAVVSLREIKAGEFFCVMESESEDNEEDDDSEGDEIEDEDVCNPCTT
jgi:hypothetical protein